MKLDNINFNFIFLAVFTLWTQAHTDGLRDVLKSYETLHRRDIIHTITKRDASSVNEKALRFRALGREFSLHLTRNLKVLANGFQVLAIDKDNNARRVDVDVSKIYQGYVEGEEESSVQATFEESDDGEDFTATIHTKEDIFVIEPSWRHLPKSNNHSMIAYRGSDVNLEEDFGTKYCGHVKENGQDEAAYDTADHSVEDLILDGHSHNEDERERYKRQMTYSVIHTPDKDTCSMLLVADYKFLQNMGQGSLSITTSYLISLIDRVNQIYRRTQWGNGFVDVGIGIKEIHIHEEPTTLTSGEAHYNNEKDNWDTKELLEVFSRESKHKKFCLSHLFTHTTFQDGSLGLSYVASYLNYNPGGICSQEYYKNNYRMYLNTGWSSSLNRYNRRLLTQEADLVTTHEIGHNWGSEHDPDTTECSPNSFNGGKYVMYTYSVSGYDPNNKIFSACSKRSIGAVLDIKSSKCFSQPIKAYCGNALVEENEDCDPGALSDGVEDPCCDKNTCLLKPNSVCSDSNDICCHACQYANADTVCHLAQNGSCEDSSYCTGFDKDCPPAPHKDNGSSCIGRGSCRNGDCVPFCESMGLMSCACDDSLDESCKWCCRANITSKCEPHDDGSGARNLPNGMPCLQGYCLEGVCKEQVQDLVQRIWDIIEQLGPNKIVAFMRANIVGTVIILSLIIWIPASCIVCYIDKKNKQEDLDEIDYKRYDNYALFKSDMNQSLRRIPDVKRRKYESQMYTKQNIGTHLG